MSAPDTNVDKQAKRHAGPIIGIAAGIVLAILLLVVYLFYIATPADDTPDNTPTGEAAVTDGNATVTPDDAANEPGAEALPDAGTEPAEVPADN